MQIHIEIGTYKSDYEAVITDAPDSYDYSAITVVQWDYPVGGTKNNARLVLIERDILETQIARYRSGLHTVVEKTEEAAVDTNFIESALLSRLRGLDKRP